MYVCTTLLYVRNWQQSTHKSHLVGSLVVEVLGSGNVVMLMLGLSLLGQDDSVLKQKYPSPVFGELHECQVTLTKNLSLLFDALYIMVCVCVCVCVCVKNMIGMIIIQHLSEVN